MDPPPQPPPHGTNPQNAQNGRSGGLPPGNYDIFVIPPHASGSGFLYLPSLGTNRNSFLAGVASTAFAFFVYNLAVPVFRDWFNSLVTSGGSGILVLLFCVGVAAWALGKTQGEGQGATGTAGATGAAGSGPKPGPQPGSSHSFPSGSTYTPPPNTGTGPRSPPKSSWQRPNPQTTGTSGGAKTSWEKAREETRKKEEERKKAEELKRRREEIEKERQKQREKDAKEREERERKQKAEREEREKKDKERKESENAKAKERTSPRKPPYPSARTETEDDAYSFRPYDRPKKSDANKGSAGSAYSASSYAASQTTARTTPPPSHRGPYSTKDPDKIIIKAVYSFNSASQRIPIAQLISGQGNVTDGLILRITTEGLFIDDDVRGVPQREWDVKAWTIKMAESTDMCGNHILRASIRDQEGKRYVFILAQTEGWKVAVGLQRLRRGSQVRAMGVAGMPTNEAKAMIENLGWT